MSGGFWEVLLDHGEVDLFGGARTSSQKRPPFSTFKVLWRQRTRRLISCEDLSEIGWWFSWSWWHGDGRWRFESSTHSFSITCVERLEWQTPRSKSKNTNHEHLGTYVEEVPDREGFHWRCSNFHDFEAAFAAKVWSKGSDTEQIVFKRTWVKMIGFPAVVELEGSCWAVQDQTCRKGWRGHDYWFGNISWSFYVKYC